jgi:hypothetical protein
MMKTLFYSGVAGLALFEIMNVYFIMPMPGSQQMNSIELAYLLYAWRWLFRIGFLALIAGGTVAAFAGTRKWVPALVLLATIGVVYMVNFKMSADHMFLQPNHIEFKLQPENQIPEDRLAVCIAHNGEAKAYPIEFLTFHHQVRDSVGGKQVMVTYCSVCRTGRVYEPVVSGNVEEFRLVGMDHFNAMFEDASTKSWWRQATGEAIAGSMKGKILPEIESQQMTLTKWFELYPQGKVMQADTSFVLVYDSLARFEQGESKGSLTRTDRLSWKDKSWVVGVQLGNASKAYDWNALKQEGVINDSIGQTHLVVVISSDGKSFAAFERPRDKIFTVKNDTLFTDNATYDFSGQDVAVQTNKLSRIRAYQEFWHSWATFHPNTQQYSAQNKSR